MDLRVVLVEPENPLNVGFVARAMKSFGATDLTVAGSAWKTMPAEAFVTGGCVPEILDGARFKTLEDALKGCDTAIAFSRRPTALRQEEFTLPELPATLNLSGKTALVFGRESAGLTRAETALCPYLARIPSQNGLSLNLGQAVAVALFGITTAATATATDGELVKKPATTTASLERMSALWEYLQPKFAASPRLDGIRQDRIRQMLFKLHLNDDDFDQLFAVMKAISR